MASDFEDVELENLRLAALKSMKSKPQPTVNAQDRNFNRSNNYSSNNQPGASSRYQSRNQFHNPIKPLYSKQFVQQQHQHQQPHYANDAPPHFYNHNNKFSQIPKYFKNNAQFHNDEQYQPNPFHQQPRSNLIVLTSENASTPADNQTSNQFRNNKYSNQNGYNSFKKVYSRPVNQFSNPQVPIKELKTDLSENTSHVPSRFNRRREDDSSDDDDYKSDKFEFSETYFNNDEAVLSNNFENEVSQPSTDNQQVEENLEEILSLSDDDYYQIELLEEESKDELNKQINSDHQTDNDSTDKMVLRNSKRLSDTDNESSSKRLKVTEREHNIAEQETARPSNRLTLVKTKLAAKDEMKSKRLSVVKTKLPNQERSISSPSDSESSLRALSSPIKDNVSPARSIASSEISSTSTVSSASNQHVKKQRKPIVFNKEDYADDKKSRYHYYSKDYIRKSKSPENNVYSKRYRDTRLSADQANSTKLKSCVSVLNKSKIVKLASTKETESIASKKIKSLIVKN